MSTPQPTPRRGRRVAERRRRSVDRGALLLLVPPVLAVLVALAAGALPAPEAAGPSARTEPVSNVVNACQRARLPQPQASPSVRMLTARVADLGDAGTVRYTPTGDRADAEEVAARRGVLTPLRAPGTPPAAGVLQADGEVAAGTATWQVDRGSTDPTLAVQECATPRAQWWFTGAGAGLDHQSSMVLTNTDPGPAVVDVTLRGPTGEVTDAVGLRGLTVQPGETVTVDMVEVAPQSEELSVEVAASRGRVVAALGDQYAEGAGAPIGTEWLGAAASPARNVVLAGSPTQADARTVLVANPSASQALVDVLVAGPDGAFAPTEGAQVTVPPGSVVSSDLTEALGSEDSAVLLRSNVPVTGTVRTGVGSDVTYSTAVSALTGPAAALLDAPRAGVQLTGGDGGGTATVTGFTEDGEQVGSKDLEAPTRGTVAWTPPRSADYVVVEPGRGEVSGAVVLSGAGGVATVPLRDLPVTLRRPGVAPALG